MIPDALIFVLLMLALGKVCARWRVLPDNSAEVLNLVVLYLCLPAAILRYAPQLQLDPKIVGVIVVPWALLLASAAAIYACAALFRWSASQRAALLLCVPLGNTSFLGYPLTEALLGAAALPYAVVYDQFGSFLMLSTWGLWVLARYGGDRAPTAGDIVRRLIRFPPFVTLVFALTLMPAEPPPVIAAILTRLSDALLPLVAVAVGLSLKFRLPRGEASALTVGLALKLALLPVLAVGLAQALGLRAPMFEATVLESAMPPMITASALAISHRLAPDLAAALVGYGTALALLTLPLWAAVLG